MLSHDVQRGQCAATQVPFPGWMACLTMTTESILWALGTIATVGCLMGWWPRQFSILSIGLSALAGALWVVRTGRLQRAVMWLWCPVDRSARSVVSGTSHVVRGGWEGIRGCGGLWSRWWSRNQHRAKRIIAENPRVCINLLWMSAAGLALIVCAPAVCYVVWFLGDALVAVADGVLWLLCAVGSLIWSVGVAVVAVARGVLWFLHIGLRLVFLAFWLALTLMSWAWDLALGLIHLIFS